MTTLAIFDFDGTLVKGHVWSAISRYHQERHERRLFLYLFYASHILMWYLTKFRFMDEETFRSKWMEDFSRIFKGRSQAEIEVILTSVLAENLEKDLNHGLLEILQQHRAQGHEVIILSGAFESLLGLFAREIGVEHFLGTRLDFKGHRCTGRVQGAACMGLEKVRRLKELIGEKGLEVDLGSSFAYADSLSDFPVLEMVGHPVVVAPDDPLKALAQERGWKIVQQE